jgi:hypothetical protein
MLSVCTSCQAKVRIPNTLAGRKIKCPKCGAAFMAADIANAEAPPAAVVIEEEEPNDEVPPPRRKRTDLDEDEDERPRRRRLKRKSGNSSWLVGILVGGVVVLMLAGLGILIYWLAAPEKNDRLTPENMQKIHAGMSLEDAEQILGKARLARDSDFEEINQTMQKAQRFSGRPAGKITDARPGTTRFVWKSESKDKRILVYVDIDDNTKRITGHGSFTSGLGLLPSSPAP